MKSKPNLIPLSLFFFIAAVLHWIITRRPAFLLFNDDLLWLAPLSYANSESWSDVIRFTFQRETEVAAPWLNFSLATYFHFFGNTPHYLFLLLIGLHTATTVFFFLTLKTLFGGQKRLAFFAAVFYLGGFPLFHAYVWPVAVQHLWFTFFHFLVLYLFISDKKYRLAMLWIAIPLASLGRTSFLFTLASLVWISFSTGRRLKKLSIPLAVACWYPLLQAYEGTWGTQVEYFVIKFPGPYKLLQFYRSMPYGWTFAWVMSLVSVMLICRHLPTLNGHRRARILIATGVAIFLSIEAVYYSEEIYYLLLSFLKIPLPHLSELSKVVVFRWQPLPLYVPEKWRILFLIFGVVLPSTTFYFLMRRFGTVMAIFFIPIVPSLYYLRSRGLGSFVPEYEGTTYYYCSRYAVYIIPFVLVNYCGLLDALIERVRARWMQSIVSAFLCAGLLNQLITIDRRLARSALAETVDSFVSMYPATLAFVAPSKEEVTVWIEEDSLSLGLRVITFERNNRVEIPAKADPLVLGASSASQLLYGTGSSKFSLAASRAQADVVRCGGDWCSGEGIPLKPRTEVGILPRLLIAPGETEAAFLEMSRVKSWKEYVEKARFSPKATGDFTKEYLLRQLGH